MYLWKNLILDFKIKLAEWNMERFKKKNELTREYIEQQKIKSEKTRQEITKQKLLNQMKQEKHERKKAELEKSKQDLEYKAQQNEALDEILAALNEIDVEKIPDEWKRKLRNSIEKKEVIFIKDEFLEILRSLTLYRRNLDE